MRALLLVLLLSTIYLPGNADAAGEDFPFFCRINGNLGESFRINSDNRSKTGYLIRYYQRGSLVATTPAILEYTSNYRHIRVRAKYQNGLFDRHVMAFIGQSTNDYSSADTPVSLHGLNPANYQFRSMRCQ